MKGICGYIAFTSLTLGALNCAEAGTITAASAGLPDVSAAVGSALDGDTVVLPATPSPVSWTSTLTITKGITLQGATTVSGDHNTQLAGTPMAAIDNTVIINNVPVSGGNNPLMVVIIPSGKSFRLTGITFQMGTTGASNNGQIRIGTASTTAPIRYIRIDHCHNSLGGEPFHLSGWWYGVVDHNIFDYGIGSLIVAEMDGYGGRSNQYGDGSWVDSPNFGSEAFIFFEDNTFNAEATSDAVSGVIDGVGGGRYVERYNVMNNCLLGGGHGTDAVTRGRRSSEYYGNLVYPGSNMAGGWGHHLRSGTALTYNNQWITSNSNLVGGKGLQVFRLYSNGHSPWGTGANAATATAAFGANTWDANDTTGTGGYVAGNASHIFATGTVSTTDTTNATLTDSTAHWAINQWASYGVIDVTNSACGRIISNTSTQLTCLTTNSGAYVTPVFNAGDGYKIYQVVVPLDGIGRGKGDLLVRVPNPSGGNNIAYWPENTVTGTQSWPRNALEPVYGWDSYNGQAVKLHPIGPQGITIAENRDFYNLNTTWTPGNPLTTGVAVGKLADRPTQCTPGTDITGVTPNPPGVAYWATDTGPSNQNGSVSGTLYVCRSTNTWTPYYTPYQYPHPLVSGATPSPSPPAAPKNLRITAP